MEKQIAPLKTPIEVGEAEPLKELTFEEPDLGVLDGVSVTVGEEGVKINLGDLPRLVANMSGIPVASARKIKASDWPEVTKAVMGFMPEFLKTIGN